jgi:hypothetical protein
MAEMSAFFPLGSTYTGTFGGVSNRQQTTSRVTTVTATTAKLRFTNDHGDWDLVLKLTDGQILLQDVEYAGDDVTKTVALFRRIDIRGPADLEALNGYLKLVGTWDIVNTQDGITRGALYIEMDFRRDK